MIFQVRIEDAGFEELIEIIKYEAKEYKSVANNWAVCSEDPEIQKLLKEESLNRFIAMSESISYLLKNVDLKNGTVSGFEDAIEEQSRLMQCWIMLGSAIECALQIFLAIYITSYKESGWHKWENYNYESVKTEIVSAIDLLLDSGTLNAEQARSFKNTVKDELKSRRDLPKLEKVMLYDLIEFYRTEVKWEQEKIDKLNLIRENRNCIHPFVPRDIGEWPHLLDALKFYVNLLQDLRTMTPDCDEI